MSSRYIFELHCPRCKKFSTATLTKEHVVGGDMELNCGECLMKDIEIVRLVIERVTVMGDHP
jgi:hypothetical protein